MFEGEKTYVFWAGLIILGLASAALFSIIWFNVVVFNQYYYQPRLESQVPFIVVSVAFILIGLYMMKSGVKPRK